MRERKFTLATALIAALLFATSGMAQSKAGYTVLIFKDGSQVPCTIKSIDSEEIFFDPLRSEDAFRYGHRVYLGQLRMVREISGRQSKDFSIGDYLKRWREAKEPAPDGGGAGERSPQEPVVETVPRPDVAVPAEPAADSNPAPKTEPVPQVPAAPVETVSDTASTSLPLQGRLGVGRNVNRPPDGGVGLDISGRLTATESNEAPTAYPELADLIVSSGAAGLVLHQIENRIKAGTKLTESQVDLEKNLREATSWNNRKQGLREAHRMAAAAFAEEYESSPGTFQRAFGFRTSGRQDPFIDFMIYLKNNGGLTSKVRMQRATRLFGEEAARAMVDLIHNFDDWYYVVVLKA